MREYRKAKDVKEVYNSLQELREAWHCKPLGKRRTKDEEKLQAQRENFCSHHLCKGCGKPMTYVGAGAMACTNPECKGIKVERQNKEGATIITYEVSYDVLEPKYAEIAENLFD